jgi:transglutaminase-like putative cysteine protease
MPTYLVRHVTTYRYASRVAFGEHRMMLRPRESHDQRSLSTRLDIHPHPLDLSWSEDASGNLVGRARFGPRARELRFEAHLEVEQTTCHPASIRVADHARTCPFSHGAEEMPDLARFIERQHADPDHEVGRWVRDILHEDPDRDSLGFLSRLAARIRRDFSYRPRLQSGIQEPLRTLRLGTGSCRDFAVLMAEAVPSLGFAARFASGYVYVPHEDLEHAEMGGHTHAWVQVYVPGAGWIDFDPTAGTVGNRDLIRVAVVRDPEHAAPLSGTFIGFPGDFLEMRVGVVVSRTDSESHGGQRDLPAEQAA